MHSVLARKPAAVKSQANTLQISMDRLVMGYLESILMHSAARSQETDLPPDLAFTSVECD